MAARREKRSEQKAMLAVIRKPRANNHAGTYQIVVRQSKTRRARIFYRGFRVGPAPDRALP